MTHFIRSRHASDEADKNGMPSVYWLAQDIKVITHQLYVRIDVKTPFTKTARP